MKTMMYEDLLKYLSKKLGGKYARVCSTGTCPICKRQIHLYTNEKLALWVCVAVTDKTIHTFKNEHGTIGNNIQEETILKGD